MHTLIKRRFASLMTSAVIVAWTPVALAQSLELNNDKERLGYAFGVQIAQNMKSSNLQDEVSVEAITAAIKDVFENAELRMTPEAMQNAQAKFQQKMQAQLASLLQENAQRSRAFIEANKAQEGVITTPTGLQYQVLVEGTGRQPLSSDTVRVHYQGRVATTGEQFDSSFERGAPADFPVSGVIPGFSEGLQLMKAGSRFTLYIPPELAYGENGPPSIGPNQALIFDIEFIEIIGSSQ
jgi:FKBP-type peptidyl-prolyl cis-trans isomerase